MPHIMFAKSRWPFSFNFRTHPMTDWCFSLSNPTQVSMGFCSHVRCRCRDITYILLLGRHLTAQQGQMLHSMPSASRRGESVRQRLALIDSSYSLASDTDLVVRPGVLSLCFPWCLRCAFVLTWYKFDTSVSKLPPNPLRGWALAASWRYTSCHNIFRNTTAVLLWIVRTLLQI